jgi:SAM-dependent methyltransferase
MTEHNIDSDVCTRAAASLGISARSTYELVADIICDRHLRGGVLLDVGYGTGSLLSFVTGVTEEYIVSMRLGVPRILPIRRFVQADLNSARWPIDDEISDVTVAVEVIEHVENPRAFFRELARITRRDDSIAGKKPIVPRRLLIHARSERPGTSEKEFAMVRP